MVNKIINKIKQLVHTYKNDPVKRCSLYKDMKCSHIDGIWCDMETCLILKEYKNFLGE